MKIVAKIQNHNKRQFGLDFIRAIAISFVLISHFSKTLDQLGFWGVELFFGLSGYLIGTILWKSFSESKEWSGLHIINFWSRRWWRTIPNYYLFFCASMLIQYFFNQPVPVPNILVKFLWFGQAFAKHYSWFFGVSWSLCIEEWFYLIFPILLLIFAMCGLKSKPAFGLSIFTIFIVCFLARQVLSQEGVEEDLRLITVARLDAIACGVLITYLISIFNISKEKKIVFFICGICLIFLSIYVPYVLNMSFEMVKGNTYLLLFVPLSGALTLPFISLMKRPDGLFKYFAHAVEKISLWSYSIYLIHMPVLTIIYNTQDIFELSNFRENTFGNMITKIVGLFLIIIFSAYLFKYFESPLTKRRPPELQYFSKQIKTQV